MGHSTGDMEAQQQLQLMALQHALGAQMVRVASMHCCASFYPSRTTHSLVSGFGDEVVLGISVE